MVNFLVKQYQNGRSSALFDGKGADGCAGAATTG